MNPIVKPWPFRGWGMDMIGKINPPSSKGHQFILAITDYFTVGGGRPYEVSSI
jgi:hypothetical protein